MTDTKEVKTTKDPEVKEDQPEKEGDKPTEKTVEKQPEKTEEKPKVEEKPLGEVLQDPEKKGNPKPEDVPFPVFEQSKKENKALKEQIKKLEKMIEDGEGKAEVSKEMDAIAEEYGVDKSFLRKVEKAVEAKFEGRIKPFEEERINKEKDKTFTKHLDQVLENKPDFKDIVNREVIKSLAYLPQNANKTLSQLIEETYGNALTGKRTIEPVIPGGGKEPKGVDFDKAKTDPEYFKEVMANPELKKQYNEGLAQRISI